MANLWYQFKYQGQGHQGQTILRSRSFQNQIVSVWISIPKRAVGFRSNAFLLLPESLSKLDVTLLINYTQLSSNQGP